MPDESDAPQAETTDADRASRPPSSPFSNRLTPEQHFVQHTIKSLAQFMPIGGSGWLLVDFLLKQEWMQALLTFPIMAVTAVWAAYSKGVLDRLSEIAAARGKKHVNIWIEWLKVADEAINWQLSGFEGNYLRCQGWACGSDDPIGLDQVGNGVIKPLLQEIFVPLELSINPQLGRYSKLRHRLPYDEPYIQSIWDLLKQAPRDPAYRQMLIRAKGGYGKTTLLKHLAYTYSKGQHRHHQAPKLIPFLIILAGSWRDLTGENVPELSEFLNNIHIPSLPRSKGLKVPPNWIAGLLARGEALVMFDGFDEVPIDYRLAVSQWINRQMREFPESVFIITSRPDACLEHYEQPWPSSLLWVRDFSESQQQQFIRQWYSCQEIKAVGGRNTPDVRDRAERRSASLIEQLQMRPELADLAGNPLLLNMMCRFHREHEGQQLPQRRVELYQDICEVQVTRRPRARKISMCLRPIQRLEVLQELALAMMLRAQPGDDQGHKQISEDDLLSLLIQPITQRDSEASAREFLLQMLEVSELLVETQDKGIYEFSHLSLQEYLAASEIAHLRQESILHDRFSIPAWKATILLYSELVNPSNLIRAALEKGSELAYEMAQTRALRSNLSETERRELASLQNVVLTSRYSKLDALMQAGDWCAADRETYRLMISVVCKEEGDWFTDEELLNFPREDLLTLDRLWTSHSKGKFGFSVQKKIYADCGAKLDGRYPGDLVWESFTERVGWKAKGKWKEASKVNVNLDTASEGEMPYRWMRIRVAGVGALLSHPDL